MVEAATRADIPCLDVEHGSPTGVVHLPVAPRCNLRCTYCDPACDCVHSGPPGFRSALLAPGQALRFLDQAIAAEPRVSAVAITGPGDPLASAEETFATLQLVRRHHPGLPLLVGTNGLALPERVDDLVRHGVAHAVVSVNTVDPAVGARLLAWARTNLGVMEGIAAARLLRDRQLAGIAALARQGVQVRVNVLVAHGINDDGVGEVARQVAAAGARALHLAPAPGDCHEAVAESVVAAAERWLPVHGHCRRCPSASLGCLPDGGGTQRSLAACAREAAPAAAGPAAPLPGVEAMAYPQLKLLARIARHLAEGDDADDALRPVLAWLDQDHGLRRGVVTLADETGEALEADITAAGVSPQAATRMRYRPGEGVTGRVFASGRAEFLPQLGAEADFLDRAGLRSREERAHLAFFCVPISVRGQVVGTLSCDRDNRDLKQADGDLALLMEVAHLLAPYVARRRLEDRLEAYQRLRSTAAAASGRLLGRAKALDEVRRLVAKVAPSTASVLITGETGTGKGVVASLIHELSNRRDQPFVELNCGAIPENLVESELFGHEKGAFTGAHARRAGVFERAKGGTVFLDEVGELPLAVQTRLLRVLQTRQFERVGGSDTLASQARVVAATNRDLEAMVKAGGFRADLFYRLSVFPIAMPALRDRGKADIMLLVDAFAQRFGKDNGKRIFRLDTPAIDMLTAYHWPGNVRELENVIERAVVLAEGEVIHGHHLPPSLQLNRYAASPEPVGDFNARVAAFETELITEALKDSGGNQTRAAEGLGMTKRMMQYKCQQYGIDWKRFK